MKRLSYSNPVLVALGLTAIAFLLRIFDLVAVSTKRSSRPVGG